MGLGIEAQDLEISLFTIAESKPPTNFFVIPTVCLFFFLVFLVKSFDKLRSFSFAMVH